MLFVHATRSENIKSKHHLRKKRTKMGKSSTENKYWCKLSHSLCKSIYQHPLSHFVLCLMLMRPEKDVAIILHETNLILLSFLGIFFPIAVDVVIVKLSISPLGMEKKVKPLPRRTKKNCNRLSCNKKDVIECHSNLKYAWGILGKFARCCRQSLGILLTEICR